MQRVTRNNPGSFNGLTPTFTNSLAVPLKPKINVDLGPMARFSGLVQRAGSVEQHALHHTIRVLRTYPRMLSRRGQFPPYIHHSQMENYLLPPALEICHDILNKVGRNHPSPLEQLVIEIDSLNRAVTVENGASFLASAQASVIYAILCLFPDEHSLQPVNSEEQVILGISELSLRLASSGMALYEETTGDARTYPSWHGWTIMSAKRRTILAIYMVTWAWSVKRNYPTFYCHELHLMHAPCPRTLWQARTGEEWLPLYEEWLSKWDGDGYRIGELLALPPKHVLDKRTEDWLQEVDEFGMLLMSQVNAI
ncbi:hypothetical protein PWT90_08471 [Aphanocladium album]|nr:hypothetical protein PWT90_08471 [Aphanocladium album]